MHQSANKACNDKVGEATHLVKCGVIRLPFGYLLPNSLWSGTGDISFSSISSYGLDHSVEL